MTTPTELRALADRVCAEGNASDLPARISAATGRDMLPCPLTDLGAAAAMMPAEASVSITQEDNGTWRVDVSIRWDPDDERSEWLFDVRAPDEKRARTAAALRVRAAMMEDGE